MRILFIGGIYKGADKEFARRYRDKNYSYSDLKEKMTASFLSYFVTGYVEALIAAGYETDYIMPECALLQMAWKNEHILNKKDISDYDVIIAQINEVKPDVLFYDVVDVALLRYIKNKCKWIKAVVGWVGSALGPLEQYKELDITFSCAQESVDILNGFGIKSIQLHHAFPKNVLQFLEINNNNQDKLAFIGSIIREKEYHLEREQMLLALSRKMPIDVYTASFYYGVKDIAKTYIKKAICKTFEIMPGGRRIIGNRSSEKFISPVNMELKRFMKPPVFGMDMFNAVYNSAMSLNIHADSSPRFSSNMRMFEITGVGSCLLTEAKENTNDLFEIDKEIVTYTCSEDCVEKVDWLKVHQGKLEEIRKNGQKRCLQDHTYDNRVPLLVQYIKSVL